MTFAGDWLPLYTGSAVVGAVAGLLGMLLADYAWRMRIRRRRRNKTQLR